MALDLIRFDRPVAGEIAASAKDFEGDRTGRRET
jgi:hypothetical protein